MSPVETSNLPQGWYATEVAGGADLRVSAPLRSRVSAILAIFAIVAGWKTVTQWQNLSREAISPWLGLTLFLSGMAIWLVVGDEVWHVERNCLVHRVGVAGWYHSRRFQDADLEIVVRIDKFSKSYYRLYGIVNG